MTFYFKIAFRNLVRHSRQSLAAVLSITAGYVSLVLFEGYIEQSRRLIYLETREKMMFGDVNIENENAWSAEGRSAPWNSTLSLNEQSILEKALSQSIEVQAWTKSLRVEGLASNDQQSTLFFAVGFDLMGAAQVRGQNWYWNAMYGVPLEMAQPQSVLLGQELGRRLGCLPSPKLHVKRTMTGYENKNREFICQADRVQFSATTPSGQISAVNLKVVGLVDAGMKDLDTRWAVMPLEMAQSLANTKNVSNYSITLKNPDLSRQFAQRLTDQFRKQGLPIKAVDWRDHKIVGELYNKVMSLLIVFKNFVVLIILCIAILSVLNTLIKLVKERTRETGTWRSLGFTNRHVILFFSLEAFLLGLAGCVIGAVLSLILTGLANSLGLFYRGGLFAESVPFSIAVVPKDYFLSSALLIGLCTAAAFWAARQVLKGKISENLIHT